MTANPVFLSIRSLGDLVRTRKVSPVEITRIFLNRLEEMGPKYNAVVTVTRDLALQQAKHAESEIGSGVYKGPLHGIPFGAKDLLATAGGIPTTWGAACFRNRCFDFDATVIRKLRDSGAILAAKHKPLGHHQMERRLLERAGIRRQCRSDPVCNRLGDLGLHSRPRESLRRDWIEAHVWARKPIWSDDPVLDAG
jgi:hypothetical protein